MSASTVLPGSKTWETLQSSRNLAATVTLSSGLDSTSDEIRHRCICALTSRGGKDALCQVLEHWELYNEKDIEFLKQHRAELQPHCIQLLTTGSISQQRAVLLAVEDLDISEAIEGVMKIVIVKRHALNASASRVMLKIAQQVGKATRTLPSLTFQARQARRTVVGQLHKYMVLYHEHRNPKIVDAWLAVAHWDDSEQRGLISDSGGTAYAEIMQQLKDSNANHVLQLLAGYLGRPTTPKRVLEILAQRPEVELAIEIARFIEDRNWPNIASHLRRLPPFACLKDIGDEEVRLPKDLEPQVWLLVAVSSDNCAQILRGALKLSRRGTSQARKSAGKVLKNCRFRNYTVIVPAMQSAASGTGPDAGLSDLVQEVNQWLESPSSLLQDAAKHFFEEFTIENLLEQVRVWPTQMCRAMAQIVRNSDPKLIDSLNRYLASPAPKKRVAALQATELTECAADVVDQLFVLLDDSRLEIRVRAIDLLSSAGYEPFEQLIPRLQLDPSTDVQDAANRAASRMAARASS